MVATDLHTDTEAVERAKPIERTPLPKVLRIFWAGSLVAFGLIFVVRSLELRAGFPIYFYHFMIRTLGDLLEYVQTFKLLHTAAFWANNNPEVTPTVAYPPFAAVLLAFLYSAGKPVLFYFTITSLFFGAGIWGVRRAMLENGIDKWTALLFPLTMAGLSFPIESLVESGNIEMLLWIFAAAGIWAYLRGYDDVAALLWGLAAATKLYPIIFLVLLISRRRYRAMAVGVASFVGATVLSMWYLGPSIGMAWHSSLRNVFGYQGKRVSEWTLQEIVTNHSMFGWAKLAATVAGLPMSKLMLPYYIVGALIFAVFFFGRIIKMPVANQLLAVTSFMIMFPPVSYFYTLVHLIAPWLVLVFLAIRAERMGVRIRGLNATILLFLPMFACFMLFTFPTIYLYGGLVHAAVLAALFLSSATYPFALPAETGDAAKRA